MEILPILSVLIIIFIIYYLIQDYNQQRHNIKQLQGTWALEESKQELFGLQSYILHIPEYIQKINNHYTIESYLVATNKNGIIYDGIVDVMINNQESKDNQTILNTNIISYNDPILPSEVLIRLDKQSPADLSITQITIFDQQKNILAILNKSTLTQ